MSLLGLRKYNVTFSANTAGSDLVRLSIRKSGSDVFATGLDWTPATGDVKVSKDGGAQANIGTLPSYSNGSWEFVLSNTEVTAKTIRVVISATAIVADDFTIETFGNASAMYPAIYSSGSAGNILTSGIGADQINVDGTTGSVSANVIQINSNTQAAINQDRASRAVTRGVVGNSATTILIPTSSLTPAITDIDQLKGRILIFDSNTVTAGLRNQASNIITNTNSGIITITALTRAPANGDTFGIY